MKTVEVVAAVIRDGNKIFATQRGYGEFKDGWEFPGGKTEIGETPQADLKREIMEELDTEINVKDHLFTVDHDYDSFHITMHWYWCEVVSGELLLKEHEAAKWLDKEHLYDVDWLPADLPVAKEIEKYL